MQPALNQPPAAPLAPNGCRLGVFTVKKMVFDGVSYWTYGGFGSGFAALAASFHEVALFAHVREGTPPVGWYRLKVDNTRVVHLPWSNSEAGALAGVPEMFRIAHRWIHALDLVHARMPDYTGIIGALLARRHGIPYACQVVADWEVQGRSVPWTMRGGLGALLRLHMLAYDRMERLACRGTLVFAQGRTVHEKHRRSSCAHLVMSTSHCDADLRAPRLRTPHAPFRVINVGRLTSVKNQELLLAAIARLARHDDWRLTIAGEGARHDALLARAAQLGIGDRVTFMGMLGHGEALWNELDRADVFALSSRSEGTPKALLEAMARGIPVVATAVSGVPGMLADGSAGLLVPDDDLDAMVLALRQIVEDPVGAFARAARASSIAAAQTLEKHTAWTVARMQDAFPHLVLRSRLPQKSPEPPNALVVQVA